MCEAAESVSTQSTSGWRLLGKTILSLIAVNDFVHEFDHPFFIVSLFISFTKKPFRIFLFLPDISRLGILEISATCLPSLLS